ncbi:MAG: hypothetical protein GF355_09495 [Candidatus Eisenbacteria bacterium]|nr:hypothetical protein [Candidatus Eisenbacteria bacterium]
MPESKRNRKSEMGRYEEVHVRVWSDDKVRRLSKMECTGQAVFIYLLTAVESSSVPGLLHVFAESICRRFGWDLERFMERFGELSREGLAMADWDAGLVWLPNRIHYKPPANPNVVIGWVKEIRTLPDCRLKDHAIRLIYSYLEGRGERYAEPFREPFTKPLGEPLGEPFGKPLPKPHTHSQAHTHTQKDSRRPRPGDEPLPAHRAHPSDHPAAQNANEPNQHREPKPNPRATDEPLQTQTASLDDQRTKPAPEGDQPASLKPRASPANKRARGDQPTDDPKERSALQISSPELSSNGQPDEIEKVWIYYLSKIPEHPTRMELTKRRRRMIAKRLTEFDPEYIKRAVDNLEASDFHMGRDERSAGACYNDIEQIVRSKERTERWVEGDLSRRRRRK